MYKQLVITDNQEALDKRIDYYVSRAKDKRLAVKVQHPREDRAKAAGLAAPTLQENDQIAEEIRAEQEAQNLDVQVEDDKELMETTIDPAKTELKEKMQNDANLKSVRENARDDGEAVIMDGTMRCKHCLSEMDLQDVICPMRQELKEFSSVARETIAEQQKTSQLEHLKRRPLVTRIKLNKAKPS